MKPRSSDPLSSALALALALAFFGCRGESFSSFKVLSQGDDLKYFLGAGSRTVIFPVVTRETDTLDGRRSSEKMEHFLLEAQPGLPVLPFADFREAVLGQGKEKELLEACNEFYRSGEVPQKNLERLAACAAALDPRFFLFLKVDRAELYKDTRGLYKKRAFVGGRLYHLPQGRTAMAFTSSALSQSAKKEALPDVEKLVSDALAAAARGLPSNPKRPYLAEKEKSW